MRHQLALGLVVILLASGTAMADMGKLVGSLKREPLSLFDWGLHDLENELQGVRRHERDFVRVQFEPALERIVVDGTFFMEADEVRDLSSKDSCYMRLHALKLMFGIIDTNILNVAPAADFRLGVKFSHRDSDAYPEQPDAAKIGAELLQSVYIRVGVGSRRDEFPFMQDMRCEGELMSQDVHYGPESTQGYLPDSVARKAPSEPPVRADPGK